MSHHPSSTQRGKFSFEPTPAVAASRNRRRYVNCAICQSDHSKYLFYKAGVRFVRCAGCDLVYVNPVGESAKNFFDIDRLGLTSEVDRRLALTDFEGVLESLEGDYNASEKRPLKTAVLLGRTLSGFGTSDVARRMNLNVVQTNDVQFEGLALRADIGWMKSHFGSSTQMVILHELLEACSDPAAVLEELTAALPPTAFIVVTYTNAASLPAKMMRRYWSEFFDVKNVFFSTNNLKALMARFGFVLRSQFAFPVTQTAEYVARRLAPLSLGARVMAATPVGKLPLPVRAGNRVAVFRRASGHASKREKLSIVFPVFNEARSVTDVLDAILAKDLKIDKELIIVESNSTDGTRDIVRTYENRPGVRVLYEERPRGKGHAVRTGLAAVTGTIVLIQDADFEYDIDDYDALIDPILQHRATFVLGSRSLGLDDWKVRKFAKGALKGLILNGAQVLFAATYNALYQQNVTDVNTMFKVFRADCIPALNLTSNGFELDIELACKLARNGNAPMEVPVNYVARGFEEGKKISFIRDSFPSYFAFFKHRFR